MEGRTRALLLLFYPFTLAMMVGGFIAFLMLLLKFPLPLVAMIVLWFCFSSFSAIYVISKRALEFLGFRKTFLMSVVMLGILAVLSTVMYLVES